MSISNIIGSMSHQTLQRLAPKVERAVNGTASEDDRALIALEINNHSPSPIQGEQGIAAPNRALLEHRRQRMEAHGGGADFPLTRGMLTPGADGSFQNATLTTFNSVEEMRAAMRESEQNSLQLLMEAINAMRATDPQQNSGSGINITM